MEVTMCDERQDVWLTVQEVAAHLKVHEESVRRWIRTGRLAVLDLGSPKAGYRIRRSDLDQFTRERYRPIGSS